MTPTTIRTTPTALMSTPSTCVVTAYLRIAPTAIRNREVPMVTASVGRPHAARRNQVGGGAGGPTPNGRRLGQPDPSSATIALGVLRGAARRAPDAQRQRAEWGPPLRGAVLALQPARVALT